MIAKNPGMNDWVDLGIFPGITLNRAVEALWCCQKAYFNSLSLFPHWSNRPA